VGKVMKQIGDKIQNQNIRQESRNSTSKIGQINDTVVCACVTYARQQNLRA
jgi:hypothetical protein